MKYLNDTGLSRFWAKIKNYLSGNYVTTSDSRLTDSRKPTSHASSATTYGVGTAASYGHCKTINNVTTNSHTNGNALSAYQGYLLANRTKTLEDNQWVAKEISDSDLSNYTFLE